MLSGPEVHDDAHALLRAQRNMRRALVAFGLTSIGVACLAPAVAVLFNGAMWVPALACVILTAHAGYTIRRLSQLRRRVWRVAVSSRHVVALDAGRRQTFVSWSAVKRIEVDSSGLTLVARDLDDATFRLQIRSEFSAYVPLAYLLAAQAERRRRPIWVDGRPWQDLPIAMLLEQREDVVDEA